MKRRLFKTSGLLLTMVIMLSVFMFKPALAAETYQVWVNGVQFTSDNAAAGIACGEGKATYNNSTNTITFTDKSVITQAYYDSTEKTWYGIISQKDELNVQLTGSLKLEDTALTLAEGDSYVGIYNETEIKIEGGKDTSLVTDLHGTVISAYTTTIKAGTVSLMTSNATPLADYSYYKNLHYCIVGSLTVEATDFAYANDAQYGYGISGDLQAKADSITIGGSQGVDHALGNVTLDAKNDINIYRRVGSYGKSIKVVNGRNLTATSDESGSIFAGATDINVTGDVLISSSNKEGPYVCSNSFTLKAASLTLDMDEDNYNFCGNTTIDVTGDIKIVGRTTSGLYNTFTVLNGRRQQSTLWMCLWHSLSGCLRQG